MKETLTVRPAVKAALLRGERRLFSVRWLFEQGGQFDWDVFWAEQRAAWVTEHARDLARWEVTGRAASVSVQAGVLDRKIKAMQALAPVGVGA
jgi:hypothetical protein